MIGKDHEVLWGNLRYWASSLPSGRQIILLSYLYFDTSIDRNKYQSREHVTNKVRDFSSSDKVNEV